MKPEVVRACAYLREVELSLGEDLRAAGRLELEDCAHLLVAMRDAYAVLAEYRPLVEQTMVKEAGAISEQWFEGLGVFVFDAGTVALPEPQETA